MDVPHADYPVFAASHHKLSARADRTAEDLVKVSLNFPVKLLPSKDKLRLTFQVPYKQHKHYSTQRALHLMSEQSFEPVITDLLSFIHCRHVIAYLCPFINTRSV